MVLGQHRIDGAPGQFTVADFTASRRPHATGFTHGIGREVVVQHEMRFHGAFEQVDELLVFPGSQRRHDKTLGLAAGKQRRAMRAGQDADL